jgi:hypothetical protein
MEGNFFALITTPTEKKDVKHISDISTIVMDEDQTAGFLGMLGEPQSPIEILLKPMITKYSSRKG